MWLVGCFMAVQRVAWRSDMGEIDMCNREHRKHEPADAPNGLRDHVAAARASFGTSPAINGAGLIQPFCQLPDARIPRQNAFL